MASPPTLGEKSTTRPRLLTVNGSRFESTTSRMTSAFPGDTAGGTSGDPPAGSRSGDAGPRDGRGKEPEA